MASALHYFNGKFSFKAKNRLIVQSGAGGRSKKCGVVVQRDFGSCWVAHFCFDRHNAQEQDEIIVRIILTRGASLALIPRTITTEGLGGEPATAAWFSEHRTRLSLRVSSWCSFEEELEYRS